MKDHAMPSLRFFVLAVFLSIFAPFRMALAFTVPDQTSANVSFTINGVTLTWTATSDNVDAFNGVIAQELYNSGRLVVSFDTPVNIEQIHYLMDGGSNFAVAAYDPVGSFISGHSNWTTSNTWTNLSPGRDLSSFVNVSRLEFYNYDGDQLTNRVNIDSITFSVTSPPDPVITGATFDAATGALVVTGADLVSNAGALNDIDVSMLSISGANSTSHTLTSGDVEITSATSFTVLLNAADRDALLGILNKNGLSSDDGTTYNLAAAGNWIPGSANAGFLADLTGNGITVSNVSSPTISSAVFDLATGVLTVTGMNIPSNTGAANDIDVSALTFTGEGGASYTLTSATDVEITSSTGFSVTLSGADLTAVAALLNANGVTSRDGTTYNLAAADNWATGAAASVDISDTSGNGIAVSNWTASVSSAPTNLVATAGDAQVSIAFTAPANDGGASITDYEYQIDGGSWVSAGTTSSPVVITGLTNGTTYAIKLRAVNSAGNGTESVAVNVTPASSATPATDFAANETVIRQMVQADAMRSLNTLLAMNQNMMRDARGRLVSSQQGQASRDIPFDIDGSFIATRDGISTQGSFFQQSGDAETGTRRLIFGDFLVQRDEESGSTTATLDARVAWERMVDDATMLGYFIGAELAHSNLEGSFAGDQDRYGMTVGAYAVHALSESLFLDGYATLGAGQNDLQASNGVLALESDYSTWTVSVGGAVTGVISQPGYDFLPELAFNYGRTQIGQVGFTGTAYGVVDNTLSLDAGDVSIASLTFRPEIQVSMDGGPVARAETVFSFSPRLICEELRMATTSSDCGTGLELGLSSAYNDGLGSLDMRLMRDWVGDATRTSFRLQFEHRF